MGDRYHWNAGQQNHQSGQQRGGGNQAWPQHGGYSNGGYNHPGNPSAAWNQGGEASEDSTGYYNQSQHRNQPPLYARGSYGQQGRNGYQQQGNRQAFDQQGGMRGQGRGMHGQYPSYRHEFNPNASSFVPRQGYPTEMLPPAYAMAPMYADHSAYRDGSYYNNPVYQNPPQMQLMYSEYGAADDEQAAYESMYGGAEPQMYIPSMELNTAVMKDAQGQKIQEILIGIEQLIADPDEYEVWGSAIQERVTQLGDEQRSLLVRIVTEMVTNASISNAQQHLPNHMQAHYVRPNPAPVLARVLGDMVKENENSLPQSILPTMYYAHNNRHNLETNAKYALLKFMAECYEHIETARAMSMSMNGESNRNGQHADVLGKAVCQMIGELVVVAEMNDERMRVCMYAVKVAGASLDSVAVTRTEMDTVLTQLNGIANGHPRVSEGLKTECLKLIEEREAGWPSKIRPSNTMFPGGMWSGQAPGAVGSASSSSSVPAGAIIGDNGRPLSLSEDERHFLEQQILEDDDLDDVYAEMEKFEQEERQQRNTNTLMAKLKVCDEAEEDAEKKESATGAASTESTTTETTTAVAESTPATDEKPPQA